jgi:hypothetical protein
MHLYQTFYDYCGYDHEEYVCFICKDQLQNCEDHGIHLCDGGKEKKEEFVYTVEKENIDAKLGNFVCIVYLTQGSLNIMTPPVVVIVVPIRMWACKRSSIIWVHNVMINEPWIIRRRPLLPVVSIIVWTIRHYL